MFVAVNSKSNTSNSVIMLVELRKYDYMITYVTLMII